ncbi:Acryloyl-CoA reductase electron transfer subunit beta [Pelotomaculum sp. FP]|uniref:electron transfer flavoprotein subunit alpha/FixB family protein n=1 Tax=Pelotomaculum sp. FP TaxID=261474 RepID=UPI001103EB78|nr:electron transfer flavoprotein subunit alpha/FixB family protein [Pelotomaculum sp. FP]TEB13874.1 Acryloyl-CoA reductase electron transfer subunit beta [Pelotomaculum sp. FP]
MMSGIWIFDENCELTLELLNAGRNLADELGVNLVALAAAEQFAREYIKHGADEVLLLPSLNKEQPLEAYVPVMVEAARNADPDVFFIGATKRGKEMATRIAAGLNTGLCTECNSFTLDQDKKFLVMERLIYGGKAIQKIVCSTRPQMATIPARTFEQAPLQEGKEGKITSLPSAPFSAVKVINRTPKVQEAVDITEAKIIVSVGRGVEKKEDIALAEELARVLGGTIGCSRPVAEDLHWLPEEVYMGISGKKVKPDLYIGLGVSGQIQHITGIRDSKVILAINRDENAPIFDASDYGIVGDLYDVVPKLIKEFGNVQKI